MANGSNDIHIEEWMIKDLQITGTEVMCFAVVYCYSKNGGSYYGGLPSLAERLGMPEVTLGRVIKRLVAKGFLNCTHISNGGRQYCDLRTIKTPPSKRQVTPLKTTGDTPQNDRCTLSKRQVTPIKTIDKYNNKYNKENNKDYSSPSTRVREEKEFDERYFVEKFNEVLTSIQNVHPVMFRRLEGLSPERMKQVEYLSEKYGDEYFWNVIIKAFQSEFLNQRDSGFKYDLDWIINENNFLKVAEDKYKELYDNKPNNNGRTNNGLAGETPQTNADRAAEWATNRIKEVLENAKRKNQGGVQGEIPDGGSSNGGFLPF